jgi:thiol-disulfide isomerase/thioredoxin
MNKSKNKVLMFTSDDCTACEISTPIIERIAKRRGVEVQEFDPVDDPVFAQKFDVNVLPTFVLLKDDQFCAELHGCVTEATAEKFVSMCV